MDTGFATRIEDVSRGPCICAPPQTRPPPPRPSGQHLHVAADRDRLPRDGAGAVAGQIQDLIGDLARDGIRAITLGDTRWKRRDMKTVQLLSQALAYRAARQEGAETAFMIEDGLVTEAASANAWIVDADGKLITRELSHAILPGITRAGIVSLLKKEGLEVVERAFTPEEAVSAREVFTTSSGAIVAPVVAIDGKPVGDGRPGPVTRRVQRLYYEAMGADVAAVAPWALG